MSKPVLLITGYRGLAETFLKTFHSDFQVCLLVRRAEAVEALTRAYPGVDCEVGDLSHSHTGEQWLRKVASRYGRLDHLINNAAISGPAGRLGEVDFAELENAIGIDFIAPTRLIHLWLRFHEEKKSTGVVVNLSGGGATQARPGFSSYSLAKTALVRLTETLAIEYPHHRFYAISPGGLMTPMIEAILTLDRKRVPPAEMAEAERRAKQGGEDPLKAAELTRWLLGEKPEPLNGKLIHAVWDDYRNLPKESSDPSWWTLRRIDETCRKIF